MKSRKKKRAAPDTMRVEYVSLDELKAWPTNPKLHDVEELEASMGRFGYTMPIAIDEGTGQMVAGHGRLEALAELRERGEKPPDRVRARGKKWMVPVLRGLRFKNADEAEAYLVADNRLVELGGWDSDDLMELLKRHNELADDALRGTGYDAKQLDHMIKVSEHERRRHEPPEDFDEFTGEKEDEYDYECPRCTYKWKGKAKQ